MIFVVMLKATVVILDMSLPQEYSFEANRDMKELVGSFFYWAT